MSSPQIKFFDRSQSLENIRKNLPQGITLISLKQVHSNKVIFIDRPEGFDKKEGDATITNLKNVALTVHTADCLPLLASCGELIGGCHAGWRGLSNGIIENWIGEMITHGAIVSAIKIYLGPAIGPCHFEVGKDVTRQLTAINGKALSKEILDQVIRPHTDSQKDFIDLRKIALYRLDLLGIRKENIQSQDDCTFCDDSKYYSYRRDGARNGRLEAVIYR